jgi:pyrimidine-nucleoside phosphorylase
VFVDIIGKKKKGEKLTRQEIEQFVTGASSGSVPDYQLSALLMAICLKGMDEEETYELTRAMAQSGETVDTSFAGGIVVDKHSTGGVSDTVTPIIVPVLAQAGLKVLKMSGRGLSHTGGTIDKLEAIPGFRTSLTLDEIKEGLEKCGAVIVAQTANLAPADKAFYALRDVTATVDSLPLIASSIMSKKLASGSDVILLDVKYGSGAFMKDREEALKLAKCMVSIGSRAKKRCAAIVSSMQQPLSDAVGCNLEMKSALSILHGREKGSLYEVAREICARIFTLAGKEKDLKKARARFDEAIEKRLALERFARIVKLQGGDKSYVYDPSLFKDASFKVTVKAKGSGYVSAIDAEAIGKTAVALGGGREKKGDLIDHSVGISFKLRLNQKVEKGDAVATLYARDLKKSEAAMALIEGSYELSDGPQADDRLLYAYVTEEGIEYYE